MTELRARWVALGVVVVAVIALVVASLYLLSTPPPPQHPVQVSFVGHNSNMTVPTGNYPIDESAATQYATDLINDYNQQVAINSATYPVTPATAHFFTLYTPAHAKSWVVLVARENWNKTNDWIEFDFAKPIQASSPQMIFYTNETAPYLRQVLLVPSSGNTNGSGTTIWTPYGEGIRYWQCITPFGIANIPLVWFTESSFPYNDTAANALRAATAIYGQDVQNMEQTLNPPYPSAGWFYNLLNSAEFWVFVVATAAVAIIASALAVRGRHKGGRLAGSSKRKNKREKGKSG